MMNSSVFDQGEDVWRDLWPFGALSFSMMSHDLHYFLIVEECRPGDSVVKSLTSKDCIQQ